MANNETNRPVTPVMLTHRATHLFDVRVNQMATEMKNISATTRRILMCAAGDKGPNQMVIAKAVGLSAPAVSVALQKMEVAGLIRRKMDRMDLRQCRVFLTEEGTRLNNALEAACQQADRDAMNGFSEEEKELFASYLNRICENLEKGTKRE